MLSLLTGIVKSPIYILNFMPWMLMPMAAAFLLVGDGNGSNFVIGWDLPSGARTDVSLSQAITYFGLFCLMIEVFKSTRTNTVAIIDMILSTLLLVAGLVAYLVFAKFGTATFLMLVFIQFIDVLTSIVVMVRAARRDIGLGAGVLGGA